MRLKPSVLPWYTAMQKWNFLFAFSNAVNLYGSCNRCSQGGETKVSCQGVHIQCNISHACFCAPTEPKGYFMVLLDKYPDDYRPITSSHMLCGDGLSKQVWWYEVGERLLSMTYHLAELLQVIVKIKWRSLNKRWAEYILRTGVSAWLLLLINLSS